MGEGYVELLGAGASFFPDTSFGLREIRPWFPNNSKRILAVKGTCCLWSQSPWSLHLQVGDEEFVMFLVPKQSPVLGNFLFIFKAVDCCRHNSTKPCADSFNHVSFLQKTFRKPFLCAEICAETLGSKRKVRLKHLQTDVRACGVKHLPVLVTSTSLSPAQLLP